MSVQIPAYWGSERLPGGATQLVQEQAHGVVCAQRYVWEPAKTGEGGGGFDGLLLEERANLADEYGEAAVVAYRLRGRRGVVGGFERGRGRGRPTVRRSGAAGGQPGGFGGQIVGGVHR